MKQIARLQHRGDAMMDASSTSRNGVTDAATAMMGQTNSGVHIDASSPVGTGRGAFTFKQKTTYTYLFSPQDTMTEKKNI